MLTKYPLEGDISSIMVKNPIIGRINQTDEELLQLLNEHNIYQIPILDELNCVVGLRTISDLIGFHKEEYPNQVILMAGGLGKRLHPITHDIPKPLVPINGKPLLNIILDNLMEKGFHNIFLSINHKGDMIRNVMGKNNCYSHIKYIEESKRLGTAGALSLIQEPTCNPILVQNADTLTTLDYRAMVKYHNENYNSMTIAVRREKIPIPYGVVEISHDEVTNIEEKPDHYYFANVGIYIINPNILDLIPKNEYYDMPTLINQCLKNNYKVGSFLVHEYWTDIGRHIELKKAQVESKEYFH